MSSALDHPIHKYPRTHHIEGSRLQPGDEDLSSLPFKQLIGRYLVVEEKMDGANSAVSFDTEGNLLLQSRGHYLTGGPREIHFTLFKQWAYTHLAALHAVLGSRYIMYGEWLYARHTIFYNHLPHYFMEFDVLDRESGEFLSTARRKTLLNGLSVVPVKVLQEGNFADHTQLTGLVGQSHFITGDHLAQLRQLALDLKLDPERALRESDRSNKMEGLYIKVEEDGVVKERYKYVRASFLTTVMQSDSHWLSRPIIPNQLAPDVDIFAPT